MKKNKYSQAILLAVFISTVGLFYSTANSQPTVPLQGSFTNIYNTIVTFKHEGQVELWDLTTQIMYYGRYEIELGSHKGGTEFTSLIYLFVEFPQGEGRIDGQVSYNVIPVAFNFENETGEMTGKQDDNEQFFETETKAQVSTEFGTIELQGQGTYKITITELELEILGNFQPFPLR